MPARVGRGVALMAALAVLQSLGSEAHAQDAPAAKAPSPITERIEQWSEHVLQLGQGTLYPALYRLERQGLVQSEWRVTANNRRARYYSLTRSGRRQLSDELAQWRRMTRAVNLVITLNR